MTGADPFVLGVDVGTQSARAGVFDLAGTLLGRGEHPLQIWRPEPDHVEQSTRDIWGAVCTATRQAIDAAGVDPTRVDGVGFDATCSLAAVDAAGAPVTISRDGDDERDVIVWMDHRAIDDARTINATKHPVLEYVGGAVSPEMQTPKLRWVKHHMPDTWARVDRWFDLADYLTWRATGEDVRSLCTTVCKWTYLGHEQRWDPTYFETIGLPEMAAEGFRSIGSRVHPPGERAGELCAPAAEALGLAAGTAVAVPLIDAHAGALGMLGAAGTDVPISNRLAVIAGTSACHLAVPATRVDVPGVWGPYFGALLADRWLLEAGISASGSFLDLAVRSHPASRELPSGAFEQLHACLDRLGDDERAISELTRDVHWQPSVLGNRSPIADPMLTGSAAGHTVRDDVDDLAVWYLAALQGLAYASRHIVEAMRDAGAAVELMLVCGGSAGNPWWLRSHADALGIPVVVPQERDAVLLGAAMLGTMAAGLHDSADAAMHAMTRIDHIVTPDPRTRAFHDAKFAVYRRMVDDQLTYRAMMTEDQG